MIETLPNHEVSKLAGQIHLTGKAQILRAVNVKSRSRLVAPRIYSLAYHAIQAEPEELTSAAYWMATKITTAPAGAAGWRRT